MLLTSCREKCVLCSPGWLGNIHAGSTLFSISIGFMPCSRGLSLHGNLLYDGEAKPGHSQMFEMYGVHTNLTSSQDDGTTKI